jgi:hypothetical protein
MNGCHQHAPDLKQKIANRSLIHLQIDFSPTLVGNQS